MLCSESFFIGCININCHYIWFWINEVLLSCKLFIMHNWTRSSEMVKWRRCVHDIDILHVKYWCCRFVYLLRPSRAHMLVSYDDRKWNRFLRYWPFERGIHRAPVNSHTKASVAGLWCFLWKKNPDWVNNREAGDLRRQRYYTHYDVTVMFASNGDKYMDCKFVSGKGIQFYLHMRYRQKYGKSEKHNWNARI